MVSRLLISALAISLLCGCGTHNGAPNERVLLNADSRHMLVRQWGEFRPSKWHDGYSNPDGSWHAGSLSDAECVIRGDGDTTMSVAVDDADECYVDYVVVTR